MAIDVNDPAVAPSPATDPTGPPAVAAPAGIDPARLRIDGLTKTYVEKDGPVLTGIDLDVAEGELVSLLGPSGCGKSTLLRIIAGFIDPSGGSVAIDGRDVTTVPTHRRNVGIVHQSHALWPHLTVAENVAFGLEMRRVKRDERARRASEMLELVGLGGYERRVPGELSGGQQQRVSLARALVIEPDVLLLDEPLSSLDANLRVYLRDEIRRIQRDLGVTTIFVTHDREEAMAVSDRIVVLDGGRIAQTGSAVDLYRTPVSHFVMSFTGATVEFSGSVVDDGGRRVVHSDLGLPCPAPSGLAVGDDVTLCIRPDDFVLGGDSSDSDEVAVVRGRLVDAAFLGTSAEIRVAVDAADGPCDVLVRLPARQHERLPDIGAPIELTVERDHVHVFATSTAT